MVGKITAVLAKKEAEAYSSQGLHHEAINLYRDLLSASPNTDPAIERAIQSQIQDLNEEMAETDAGKGGPLSHEEIARIRQGWGTSATPTDILVCAHAFYQIGSYADALKEFTFLLKSAGLKKAYVHGVADCLACLHSPEEMVTEAARLTKTISSQPKSALAALLAMAKYLAYGQHNVHAIALFKYLKQHPALASMADEYLSKLAAVYVPRDMPPAQKPPEASPDRFSWKRIGRLFSGKSGNDIDPDG